MGHALGFLPLCDGLILLKMLSSAFSIKSYITLEHSDCIFQDKSNLFPIFLGRLSYALAGLSEKSYTLEYDLVLTVLKKHVTSALISLFTILCINIFTSLGQIIGERTGIVIVAKGMKNLLEERNRIPNG